MDWHTAWNGIGAEAERRIARPGRLTGFDAVEGRSGTVYADWLKDAGIEVTVTVEHAARDPFRGYAIRDELPDAVAVLDAFYVVKLASTALDEVRRLVQQDTLGRRGRKDDPLYRIRRTLMIGLERLTDPQKTRLDKHLLMGDPNGEVRLAWRAYQRLRAIYHATSPETGRQLAEQLIKTLHTCPIPELAPLSRTSRQWRTQILAYFTTCGVNNGVIEKSDASHTASATSRTPAYASSSPPTEPAPIEQALPTFNSEEPDFLHSSPSTTTPFRPSIECDVPPCG